MILSVPVRLLLQLTASVTIGRPVCISVFRPLDFHNILAEGIYGGRITEPGHPGVLAS